MKILKYVGNYLYKLDKMIREKTVKPEDKEFVEGLEKLGFYKYVDESKCEELKKEFIVGTALFTIDTGRVFFADAENLAEGGVGDFIKGVSPYLNNQGVKDIILEECFESDQDYTIDVNTKRYLIYKCTDSGLDMWKKSTVMALFIINRLLEDVNSSERIYLLYGDNDGIAVFLTPQQHTFICSYPFLPESERPILINDQTMQL